MSIARKIMLLALTALAAMALAATSANAQEVEVVAEPAGPECVAATGNCTVTVGAESHIVALPSGVEVSTCEDTFNIEWNHDGTGHVHWLGLAHGGAGCNLTNCTVMPAEWEIEGSTEISAGVVRSVVHFCLKAPPTTELECTANVDIGPGDELHHYSVTVVALCANGARRVEVNGETTTNPSGNHPVEFLHH